MAAHPPTSRPIAAIRSLRRDAIAFAALVGCWMATTVSLADTSDASHPPVVIDPHHVSIGELAPGQTQTVGFRVENRNDKSIRIVDLAASDDGLVLHSDDCVIEPGGTGTVSATIEAGPRVGPWWVRGRVRIRWTSSEGATLEAQHPIAVCGFINSAYDPPQPMVDLGIVDPAVGGSGELHIGSREVQRLEVYRTRAPDGVSVEAIAYPDDPQSMVLRVRIPSGAPEGLLDETIVVDTNVDRQPVLSVGLRARIYGNAVPVPVPVRFVRAAGSISGWFELRRRSGTVSVHRMDSNPTGMVIVNDEPCVPDVPGCRRIEVSPRGMRPLPDQGAMVVHLEDGVVVTVPFVLKQPASAPPASLLPFLRQEELGRPGRLPASDGPDLRWEVMGDAGVFGYIIYRSFDRAGPFVRVGSPLVPALGTRPGEIAAYSFSDPDTPQGAAPYYYVDALLVDGERQRLTGAERRATPAQTGGPPE